MYPGRKLHLQHVCDLITGRWGAQVAEAFTLKQSCFSIAENKLELVF